MRIVVSGASGLVGRALVPELESTGHTVLRLARGNEPLGAAAVRWDPGAGTLDTAALAGVEAAIHLAGENIAGRRWTAAHKARVRDSRVRGTHLVASALAGLDPPPRVLVCASASGYYGDRGATELREESTAGDDFLAGVCRAWEAAADPARQRGVRVVHLRLGIVLDPHAGALERMLPVFRAGLGAPLGSGHQYWPWVTRGDVVRVIRFALDTPLAGPVNVAAPEALTNRDWSRTLARVLGRPLLPPVPGFVLRLALGEMSSLLLASQRLVPARLLAAGFAFQDPPLAPALQLMLGKRA
jgi:uncharacterized protein